MTGGVEGGSKIATAAGASLDEAGELSATLTTNAPGASAPYGLADPAAQGPPGQQWFGERAGSLAAAHRYQRLGELARGGAGRILRARDLAFDRIVALKEPLDPARGADRLRAEAAILAALQHPSIVPVYDHGTRDGVPFFAMKLVEGRSLRDVIGDARSFGDRLALLPQVAAVAEAAAYAHARGVIHRDLKPANVVVGQFGETIVIDWGLAKALDREPLVADGADRTALTNVTTCTATGAIMGPPVYMSPEQARGEPVDASADVYALGAILYHVLTGAAPYAFGASRDVIAAVLAGSPTPIEDVQPRVPADLAAIVRKAMARRPGDRYANAGGLAEDLVRFQTGRLVGARRYTPIARVSRFVRRRAGWIASAAVAVASAAAALALAPAHPVPGAECVNAGARVAAVWNDTRRAAVAAAFTGTGRVQAAGVGAVLQRVDRAAQAQADARVEACQATKARGEQSEAKLDLRIACLDQQLAQLDATVGVMEKADAAVVDAGFRTLGTLDDPRMCARVERLAPAPTEPVDPAVRKQLADLRARLVVTDAAIQWRRERAILEEVRAIAAQAERIGYCPVAARASYQLGTVLAHIRGGKDDSAAAQAVLRRAALEADGCGDDRTRALALIGQLGAVESHDHAGLERVSAEAQAAARRLDDPAVEIRLLRELTWAERSTGHVDRALASMEKAYALSERTVGAADPESALDLAMILADAGGDLERAEQLTKAGIAELGRLFGNDHPLVGNAEQTLARIYYARGLPAQSSTALRDAIRILEPVLGHEHEDVLSNHVYLAYTLVATDHVAEALAELERARPIVERVLGRDHEISMVRLETQARAYRKLGRLDEALALARELVAARQRIGGADHYETGHARALVGKILDARGDHAGAVAELRAALAVQTKAFGAAHPDTVATSHALEAALAHRPGAVVSHGVR